MYLLQGGGALPRRKFAGVREDGPWHVQMEEPSRQERPAWVSRWQTASQACLADFGPEPIPARVMDLTSQHQLEVETKGQCQLEVKTQGSASQSLRTTWPFPCNGCHVSTL